MGMRNDLIVNGAGGQGARLILWRDDVLTEGFVAVAGLTSAEYNTKANDLYAQGLFPYHVDAGGTSASTIRFDAVFARSTTLAARTFSVRSLTGDTNMPGFDNWMKSLMQRLGARSGSLAITRNADLVYARGYNLAEPGYQVTQPTTPMRIASCTKPITSIAIQQLVESGSLDRTQKAYPLVYSGTTNGTNKTVTVDQLLYHTGGQYLGRGGYDAMFSDARVASDLGKAMPINKDDVLKDMANYSPDYTPKAKHKYSNYGFSLLGQVIEAKTTKTYTQSITDSVLKPLGISGQFFMGQSAGGGAEPRYEQATPQLATTVRSASGSLVAYPYGGFSIENMDSHGQWVGSTVHLARILAVFDASNNPLFTNDTSSRNAMWTLPSATTYPNLQSGSGGSWDTWLRGWFRAAVPAADGTSLDLVGHNGSLGGTACLMAHRSDGITFSLLLNRNVSGNLQLGAEGRELSDIANTITSWPTTDRFPEFGMPAL